MKFLHIAQNPDHLKLTVNLVPDDFRALETSDPFGDDFKDRIAEMVFDAVQEFSSKDLIIELDTFDTFVIMRRALELQHGRECRDSDLNYGEKEKMQDFFSGGFKRTILSYRNPALAYSVLFFQLYKNKAQAHITAKIRGLNQNPLTKAEMKGLRLALESVQG